MTTIRTIALPFMSLLHLSFEAPANLTNILQSEAYLTSEFLFSNLQVDLIEHV
jgi:hypothetical protein